MACSHALRALAIRSLGLGCGPMLVLAAQTAQLNGPLAEALAGDVRTYSFDPSGTRMVYVADQESDEIFELFSAPANGSAPAIRLSGDLVSGGSVLASGLGFGSGRVVFVADKDTVGVYELFSVPIDGSAPPVKLSAALGPVDVFSFWVTADGAAVLFEAGNQLFSVPTDGSGGSAMLSAAGHVVDSVWLSPDGASVCYSEGLFDPQQALYALPSDGSAAPILIAASSPGLFGSLISEVRFTTDGLHAVYSDVLLDEGQPSGPAGLYGVPLDGSQSPSRLDLAQACCGFEFRAGEDRVVYVEPSLSGTLYSIAVDGTQRVQLTPAGWFPQQFVLDSDVVVFGAFSGGGGAVFRVPLDGSQAAAAIAGPDAISVREIEVVNSVAVVFRAYRSGSLFEALYAVALAGGPPPVLLNGPELPGQGVKSFDAAPNGLAVVFRGDQAADELFELFRVPIGGGQAPERLNAALSGPSDVVSFQIASHGLGVAYLSDQTQDETFELFGVPIGGGAAPFRYNDPLPTGPVVGDVLGFQAAGERAVYRADGDSDEFFELYSARIDGRGRARRLTASFTDDGDVLPDFALSPAGGRVVFQYDGADFRLYSALVTGAEPPLELDSLGNQFPAPFVFTPDGTRVVYRKVSFDSASSHDLRSAVVDGSSPPVTLAEPPGFASVNEFQLAPDGATVVFRSDLVQPGVIELFRIPTDGSAAALGLSSPLVPGGDVDAFRIGPDSSRVAYRADAEVDGTFELYSVPCDGSAPAVKLNAALVAGGDVAEFVFTPDGQRVVYRADQASDEVFELFSVPIDASAAPVRLNAALAAGRDVTSSFAVLGSGRALYLADQDVDEVLELYSVPVDGSASPLKLNGALSAGADVSAFEASADGSRVAYLADQRVNNVVEPFSVPPDGSAPAVALDTLPVFADVTAFRIDPDSSRVVYLADRGADLVHELFSVPLDGSAAPERLNPALIPGGDVEPDFLPLPGGRVLYRADQQANDVFELFSFLALDELFLPAPATTGNLTR